jgi:hypothetical protein
MSKRKQENNYKNNDLQGSDQSNLHKRAKLNEDDQEGN